MGSTPQSMTELQGTYSVFTGTDIFTVFQDQLISTMQGISYSITRQKAPVYTMGSADPRSVARSKRGIAGSMIMSTFDRHCLADFMRSSMFFAKRNSIETTASNPYRSAAVGSPLLSAAEANGTLPIQMQTPADINASMTTVANVIAGSATVGSEGMAVETTPMFTDQLLPFDTTLMGANEYGVASKMRIFGLEILNEGSGVSIDDTSNEVQMTYIARLISPWVNGSTPTTNG